MRLAQNSCFPIFLFFQKTQRVAPFTISKSLSFLSLRYGADFRRYRLVFHRKTMSHSSQKAKAIPFRLEEISLLIGNKSGESTPSLKLNWSKIFKLCSRIINCKAAINLTLAKNNSRGNPIDFESHCVEKSKRTLLFAENTNLKRSDYW